MGKELREFLRSRGVFSPEREIKEFFTEVELEKGLCITITERVEIVGSTSNLTKRPGYLKPVFQNLSHEGGVFIARILDAMRFHELVGGFVSNILNTKKPVHIGTVVGSCVTRNGVISLAITEEARGWTVYLDKYECRVVSSVLGKILNQCEFP